MVAHLAPRFSGNGLHILEERYLLPGETPEKLIDRCSFGNSEYYNMLASLKMLPNSPTLFNAGTSQGTLSACFKFDVPDDLGGIFDVAKKAGLVLKYGGGVGYCLSALRPEGSPIRTTHKIASGPVGFMELYQATANTVTQGGRRQGAQMAILHCDHPDIEKFIHCKDNEEKANKLNTFNISVAATDEFMAQRIAAHDKSKDDLLWQMALGAWATGDPGCYFIDEAERHNPAPWTGKLTATNPCGEVPLVDNEPCNLGSINLSLFTTDYLPQEQIDWDELEATTRLATRYLDDVLDHNQFPHPDITAAALLTRKLGLGVMGWADLLAIQSIPYDSEYAIELAREIMSKINRWSLEESWRLSEEKGVCPAYDRQFSAEEKAIIPIGPHGQMPRNATRTCIAPTGTISILAGCSSGIEPHFALEWKRNWEAGTRQITERVPVLGRLKSDFTPKTAMEISWDWHVKHQAAYQEHVDLATSKTINMPNSATPDEIYDAYVTAWATKCKGITIYRNASRSQQVLDTIQTNGAQMAVESVASVNTNVEITISPIRRKLPVTREALTHKFQVGDQEGYITVGLYDDGSPGELFVRASKAGGVVNHMLDSIGILTSIALQHGVPLTDIVAKFRNTRSEPAGLTSNPDIPLATSILDYIFHWVEHKFVDPHLTRLTYDHKDIAKAIMDTGIACPDCGSTNVAAQEGCVICHQCGWTRCG